MVINDVPGFYENTVRKYANTQKLCVKMSTPITK